MWKKLCRLCSASEDLLWVLDPKMTTDNVDQIVETMCGVKISNTDAVSQMVCRTCCQVTIKMHQFRLKAIKNDEELRARYAAFLVQKANEPKPKPPPKLNVHFSVREVMKKHPKVKLPNECLQSHVGAYITLMSDEIDDYLEEHNLTYEDIGRYTPPAPKPPAENNRKRAVVSSGKKAVGPAPKKATSGGQKVVGPACKKPVNNGKKVVGPTRKEEKPYASFVIKVVGPAVEDLPTDKKVDPKKASANTLLESWLGYQTKEKKQPEEVAKTAAAGDTSRQITLTSSLLASQPQDPPADNTDTFMEFFKSRPFLGPKEQEVHVVDDDDDDVILVSQESSKSSFVEALQLVPSNQPDLSLVSVAKKTHTLYICKICGSQHSTLREMKIHERRTHTKCPFCHKHFRTLIARSQHLIRECTMTPLKMKDARLPLVRVDEDPEVLKKFPSAFPKLKPNVPEEEIVCIDDEETPQRTYNVVNSDIVKNINSHDNDLTVLKKILTASQKDKKMPIVHNFSDCPIVNGETSRVKVFKNLRKYLNTFRIPIEVECGAGLTVEYRERPPPPKRLFQGSWSHMVTKQLEPFELPQNLFSLPATQPTPFPLNENKKKGSAIAKKKTSKKKKKVKPLVPPVPAEPAPEPVAPMVPTYFLAPISMGPSANEAASTNSVNYVLVPAVQTATSAGSPIFSAALSTSFTSSPGMSMNSFSSPVTDAPQMNSFTSTPVISRSSVPSISVNGFGSSPVVSTGTSNLSQLQTDSFTSSPITSEGISSASQVISVPSSPITSTGVSMMPQVSLGSLPIISAVASMAAGPMSSFTSSPILSTGVSTPSHMNNFTSSPIPTSVSEISLGTLPIISSVSSMAPTASDTPNVITKSEEITPTDERVAQLASITDALMPTIENVATNGYVKDGVAIKSAEVPMIRVKNVKELS